MCADPFKVEKDNNILVNDLRFKLKEVKKC